jgi:hypothetical protein
MSKAMAWKPLPEEEDLFHDVFIDESSKSHRYLIHGGLIVPWTHGPQLEADIIAVRANTNTPAIRADGSPREMKWEKVAADNLDACKAVIASVFDFARRHQLSSLKSIGMQCSAVDTHQRSLLRTGKGRRETAFEIELSFLCTAVIRRRYPNYLFRLFVDRDYRERELRETRQILNFTAFKNRDGRLWPFRSLKWEDPEQSQALQVVDILIGALAYKLNGHYDKQGANQAKKALHDWIWGKWRLPDPFISTSFAERRHFMTWLHRPEQRHAPRSGPQNVR